MKFEVLGDNCKFYEGQEAQRRLMPLLPVCVRVDGRAFHTFTKDLDRPYDDRFMKLMLATTRYLVEETNACIGYTQSDEISLILDHKNLESQIYFDGRIQKMVSQIAAQATLSFYKGLSTFLPNKSDKYPTFDCRVWNVPNKQEAVNTLLWREADATKNSVSMAARAKFSHKQVDGKNRGQMMDMLHDIGINWNDYPPEFKRGSYVQKRLVARRYSTEELELLPHKHEARVNPDLVVNRTEYVKLDMPPISKVSNQIGVVFYGEEPQSENK